MEIEKRPRAAPEEARGAQEAKKFAQENPKSAKRAPRAVQECQKGIQERAKTSQEQPEGIPERPARAQERAKSISTEASGTPNGARKLAPGQNNAFSKSMLPPAREFDFQGSDRIGEALGAFLGEEFGRKTASMQSIFGKDGPGP